ncbi:MAG: restriction endonuclease subunit S [Paraclostridium sp.]
MKEGYKKTEVGVIPEDWEVKYSKDVFNIITDYVANGSFASLNENVTYKNEEDYAILIRLMDYKNEYKGPFVYVDKKSYEFLGKSKLMKEDIIISNVGAYAGYVFKAPNWDKPMTLGPNAILVRTNEIKEYIYYWLSSSIGQNNIKSIISTTAQPKFNKTDFKNIKILLPSLKEQEKIAEILSSVDSQIDDTEMLIEKCRVLKKGLMQRLLSKGIGHSEFKMSEVGEIPVDWEVKKFKDISKVNQGLQIAIEDRFKEKNENRLPYITIQYINDKNNKDNEFYIENANASVICTEDDILMTRTGNTGEVVTNEHGVFHNNFFKIDFDRDLLDKDYLVYYLKSKDIQGLIRRYAGTTTIPDLKHSDFYRIPVLMPSIKEQEKIAQVLLAVDDEIEAYESKKQSLEELKKGLMQQLLTGKIRTI